MTMFVKNIADHLRPGVKKHVVAEGRRPVGYGQTGAQTGDQTTDKQQRERRAGEDDRESMGPGEKRKDEG